MSSQPTNSECKKISAQFKPVWLAIGVAVGAGVGVALHHIALGVGAGVAIGAAVSLASRSSCKKETKER